MGPARQSAQLVPTVPRPTAPTILLAVYGLVRVPTRRTNDGHVTDMVLHILVLSTLSLFAHKYPVSVTQTRHKTFRLKALLVLLNSITMLTLAALALVLSLFPLQANTVSYRHFSTSINPKRTYRFAPVRRLGTIQRQALP